MKKKTLCALALWLALPMLLFGCGDTANTPTAPSESISISADIEPRETISASVEESAPVTEPQETTILIEPDPIVEEHTEESAEPNIENMLNMDISAFTGVYAMYDQPLFNGYGYPPTIVLEENGRISGQILSGKTPLYVTQNDNGTLTGMISEGEQKFDKVTNMMLMTQPREFYVICPAGVTSGFDSYPDYDYLGTDTVRIRYMVIDGGILDIMYHKIS